MPSLIQLVNKVLPQGTRVISGETGIYNEISWVIVVRPAPPGLNGLKGNELAIIGPDIASGLGVSSSYLVSTLAERGVGGIGILGEISPEIQREAQSKKIPLVQLPTQINVDALEATITQLIGEERQLLYQKERELNHSLMDLALSGRGISAIVQNLHTLTGRNLGLIDNNYKPYLPLDPELKEVFKEPVYQALAGLRSRPASISSPVIGLNLTPQRACFLGLIRVAKEIKGYLILLASAEDISEVDRLAVKIGTLALAVEMSRRQAVEETEARFESDILDDLLNGDFSADSTDEIARKLNLNLSVPVVCTILRPANPSFQPAETIKSITSFFPKARSYLRNGDIVILLQAESLKTVMELRKIGKEIIEKLTPGTGEPFTVGTGRSCSGITGIQKSFREAEQALAMGLQLFGRGSITCFTDLGIYRLLFSLKSSGELTDFHNEYLGALAEYDLKHDGELIYTLKAYLHYSAVADSARAIHVHRNTLLYRLSRIQEIIGADLEDGETRLALHMAILAGEVINANS